jgi:chromosomal replication initiator protein
MRLVSLVLDRSVHPTAIALFTPRREYGLTMSTVWEACISRLEQEISKQQFNTWIQPLRALVPGPGELRVLAPNRFVMQWVRDRYFSRIQALANEVTGATVQVSMSLESLNEQKATAQVIEAPSPLVKSELPLRPTVPFERRPAPISLAERSNLIPSFTLESFVAGKANQLARAAAMQVAEHPGTSYNPLFVYGGVGLGKTHLIQAVGNFVQAQQRSARVRYLHATQYVSDVVRAYQQKSFDEFKRDYHSLDVLLIDDIQFFTGKDRTQEEFFYAFNALIESHKQVIITSDTYPKEIVGLDERLKSRFIWGLTVAIEPPEQEMRVAIILKKAEALGTAVPEEVAFYIAKHLRSNVRELEGALNSVLAFANFSAREINLDLAKEALRNVISIYNRQVSIENIQKTVADFYKIKVSDMHSKKRSRNVARPRQVAMALAKELTQLSLPDIGDGFGNRDHTTVLHACRTIASLREKDPSLNRDYHVLEQVLKG